MSKANSYPHLQAFNIGAGHRNKTKKNSWWSKPPFHNNQVKKEERK